MKTITAVTTSVLFLGAVAAVIYLAARQSELRVQIEAAEGANESLERQIEQLNAELKTAAEASQSMQTRLSDAQASISELESLTTRNEDENEPSPAAADAPEPDAASENPLQRLSGMFEGEKGEQFARTQARMALEMQYGAFFKEMALEPEVEEQVRELLATQMAQEMMGGVSAMSGGKADMQAMGEQVKLAKEQLRSDLAQILSEEELAEFDAYQAELPRHVMEQSLDMQMTMFAPGIDQDSRTLVRDVLIEELMSAPELAERGMSALNMPTTAIFDAQVAAIDVARERLSVDLTPEQMTEVNRFLEQQRTQLEMAREMMGGMLGESAAEASEEAPE